MTRVRGLGALAAAGLLASAAGCVSSSDIDGLHKHVGVVEKQVDALQKQSSSKDEMAKLNDSLAKQSATLLRSNADLGAKFDELTREMQTLAGKLEDTNRRLSQLSQQIAEVQSRSSSAAASALAPPGPGGAAAPAAAPTAAGGLVAVPAAGAAAAASAPKGGGISPADLFAQATADYQRGRYDLSRQGFEDYAEKFPRTDLSDDALYWAGECWSAQKKPHEAIAAYDKLFRTYPQSDKAAAAHLKKGLAHLELGEKAQAMVELNYVVNQFPGSDEAKSARQRLKALGGDAR
ncbi:MAG: tol-pal system protein YbgF [Acidobacteria bacterium]|nr:tol-pal system protein YbgF [Acidobacteriota bacterium]